MHSANHRSAYNSGYLQPAPDTRATETEIWPVVKIEGGADGFGGVLRQSTSSTVSEHSRCVYHLKYLDVASLLFFARVISGCQWKGGSEGDNFRISMPIDKGICFEPRKRGQSCFRLDSTLYSIIGPADKTCLSLGGS